MKQAFRQQFDRGTAWFDDRPVRERAMITVTAVVLVLFVGWELCVAPVMGRNDQLQSRLDSLANTQASLLEQQQVLTARLSSDPSQQIRDRLPVFEDGPGTPEDTNSNDNNETREPLLFAHDAEIAIRGGYMDVLAYLETLEAMDARLGWVLLDYDVSEYPHNEIRVRVRTLSLDRAWLGV